MSDCVDNIDWSSLHGGCNKTVHPSNCCCISYTNFGNVSEDNGLVKLSVDFENGADSQGVIFRAASEMKCKKDGKEKHASHGKFTSINKWVS